MQKTLKDKMTEAGTNKTSSVKEPTTSPKESKTPVTTEESEISSDELLECEIVRAVLDEIDSRNDIGDAMRKMPLHTKLNMIAIMRQTVRNIIDGASK